jgi:hypothetical protein
MKYHYFHGRFTYSVKRSGPPRAGRPAPVPLRSVSILELKRERVVRVTRVCARANRRHYSVARSELGTLPDGEFDWGGTSVKR